MLLKFQDLWNLTNVFIKNLWKYLFKCFPMVFLSSVGWVNQGVTFLIVPPKDGFSICGHVSHAHEVLFHYQKYPQPCIKFNYHDSI
jgi:hypothetical protein